jgi:hypothetical protein
MAVGTERKINFTDERERELFATALLGEQAITFFQQDPIGRFLHARAKLQIQQAEVDALEVNPDGWRGWFQARRKLREIRQRAAVARLFISWLADAITDGQNATKELDEYG